jgi:hypothetical protein
MLSELVATPGDGPDAAEHSAAMSLERRAVGGGYDAGERASPRPRFSRIAPRGAFDDSSSRYIVRISLCDVADDDRLARVTDNALCSVLGHDATPNRTG